MYVHTFKRSNIYFHTFLDERTTVPVQKCFTLDSSRRGLDTTTSNKNGDSSMQSGNIIIISSVRLKGYYWWLQERVSCYHSSS